MGYAIAQALIDAGASVTLVSGPTNIAEPLCEKIVCVSTALQMFEAVKVHLTDVDVFFSVAAVADYTPATPQVHKMKKMAEKLTIALVPTADILAWVAAQTHPPFCVGFAAESENIAENARKKRLNKGIPLIIANSASAAIGADDNEITLIDESGEYPVPKGPKIEIARIIVDHVAKMLASQAPQQPSLKSVKNA